MSIKRISKFILDINQGKAINLRRFIALIKNLNLERGIQNTDIEARKLKGEFYVVAYINNDLMCSLTTLINTGVSRVEAARQNRSHSAKINGSFVLVREARSDPLLVIVDEHGNYRSTLNYSSKVLIVENRQNFIEIEKMVQFLIAHTSFKYEDGINVIYSEGNEITNSLHQQFLSRYEQIFLCLDFDLGGLRIANNLMNLLPNTTFDFLVPNDIESRLDQIQECVNKEYLDQVINLGIVNAKLAPYAQIIKNKKKVLEQEGYLYG
ncbi:MAG: hypothetical protein Q8M40_12265 [Legionella sp.]|nr:hypothetical protein [Legionella sp.]